MLAKTKETQYQFMLDIRAEDGLTQFGIMSNQCWQDDPRRIAFFLARYKFVSKMLRGKKTALEVGCGDGFGTRIICQEVPKVTAIDFDPVFVEDVNRRMSKKWPFACVVHDMLKGPMPDKYEAAYSLDVLEHIMPSDEDCFIRNVMNSLTEHGVFIAGMPSLQSQSYASKQSKEGHVNCKDHEEFRKLMLNYYHNVFMFSMNDEVVHTGFGPMAHYLIAMCVTPRFGR
jgi:cyclopropane fatty-acyl-phospholipid synthase-like methyltransferase